MASPEQQKMDVRAKVVSGQTMRDSMISNSRNSTSSLHQYVGNFDQSAGNSSPRDQSSGNSSPRRSHLAYSSPRKSGSPRRSHLAYWSPRKSGSPRRFGVGPDHSYASESESRGDGNDEEALMWAALERLPTFDRLRTTVLEQIIIDGSPSRPPMVNVRQVDVRFIGANDRDDLMRKLFALNSTEEDNGAFLRRLRQRTDRVQLKLPTVEVRYQNVTIDARCQAGGHALPTLYNSAVNAVESLLDLVGLSVRKKISMAILRDVSGIINPARMTLLLGPPSSGKTTLLLALAGRLATDLKSQGEISYNGYKLHEFVPQKTSAYISQNDLHVGEMTVRETLDFSARCQGVGSRYDLLKELLKREKARGITPEGDVDFFMKAIALKEDSNGLVIDYILKILGLDICADTLVGDQMRRGISGGQKKRVTTGEMIVGPMTTLFMDDISTGLDSSTTYQVVRCLSDFAHELQNTILISLLQPAPETYNLFDDIILLSEGQIVYHGPRENILEFFESCGYKCPERKSVADFLQEVTSLKDQQQYWADKKTTYRFTPVEKFAEAYKEFHVGAAMAKSLDKPFNKKRNHVAALVFHRYSVAAKELLRANLRKEVLLVKRNSFIFIFKAVQIMITSFITMTLFFRTRMRRDNLNDARLFSGTFFFGASVILFNGYAELPMTINRLPVFYKQRDLFFFPAWTFSVSKFILSIPISIFDTSIWTVLTYYTIGYAPEPSRFFRQFLLYFLEHQMASALFRFIAGLCRSMVLSESFGTLAVSLIFILGGFLIPRTSIKAWWIWGYWTSPLSYLLNGIEVNEFLAPEWNKTVGNDTLPLGLLYLKSAGFFPKEYRYWIAVAAMIGFTALFNLGFTVAITYMNAIGGPQAVITKETLAKQRASVSSKEARTAAPRRRSSARSSLDCEPYPSSFSNDVRDEEYSTVSNNSLSFPDIPLGSSLSNQCGQSSFTFKDEYPDVDIEKMAGISPASPTSIVTQLKVDALSEVDEAGEQRRGMILPFQPLAISFNNVQYSVAMPAEMKRQGETKDRLQLLRNVTGAFRPGVLTALVGVSGAGKSTLMDVLAGRKTGGYIEGDIRIAGFPKIQETFSRISGYCEQSDIHSPQVTIYESLIYSAWLRLEREIDDNTRGKFVEEVMDLVELTPLRHALVGLPGVSGLSTEQRKRLTVAVELVANPSIIFMDEPTSGLDARAAAIVMRTVKNTVDTGRTVVCTIHQPSSDIFEAFDELLLMKRGGQVIYAGPLGRRSQELVDYFEAVPGVPKIKDGYNPATWMLEVSSISMEHSLNVDYAEIYEKSPAYRSTKALVEELSVPREGSKDQWFPTQFSQPFPEQMRACLWKQNLTYWRSPDYNNERFFFTTATALAVCTIFWQIGKDMHSEKNLFSIMGAMYAALNFVGGNNALTVLHIVTTERTVVNREKASGMYSAIPYAIAQVLTEIPYILVQTIVFSFITYSMIGLDWTAVKFLWYLIITFCTFLYFTYYGMMMASISPNVEVASVFTVFFYSTFNLFSGFLITERRIPGWWIWYYWICPFAWSIYGIITSQFGDLSTTPLTQTDGSLTTMRGLLKDTLGFQNSMLPAVAATMVAFPVLFAVLFIIFIKLLSFQNR